MSGMIGLDFETYGAVDLPTHGLARYVGDKSFMPLIGSVTDPNENWYRTRFDFVANPKAAARDLRDLIGTRYIVAHNAPFEHAVLDWLGLDYPVNRFIDSAVVALAAGAGPRLEAAAPQLLNHAKMEEGKHLIKIFSVPGKYQEESGNRMFDERVISDHVAEWVQFGEYCDLDSELGLRIVDEWLYTLTPQERDYMAVTHKMNRTGWPVDIPLVEEMQRRYLENIQVAEAEFRARHDAHDLNLNSLPQLTKWCADRGIRSSSFDKKKVESLLRRIQKKALTMSTEDPKFQDYCDVIDLLKTKQIIGGSSLKKLQVILDTSVADGWRPGGHRLMGQYQHCGAGQTLRTTGRSVQMQNLKRLGEEVADMSELEDEDSEWDNDMLAANLRQCFVAREKGGRLIVGDFSSVESRGLAWLAGAKWKLDAYRAGLDMYKVLATKIFGGQYDDVTKPQRQTGKVGELACGYGAGPGAVKDFAAGMGVELEEAEAGKLVSDWRAANPEIETFWYTLNDMLHRVVSMPSVVETYQLPDGFVLSLSTTDSPASLQALHKGARTLEVFVRDGRNNIVMKRYFHGIYLKGRDVLYHKPSERKTGDLWRKGYTNPKTKQWQDYKLYGGKLAGILTQSFCRELFMQSLLEVYKFCRATGGQVQLVGQFHDEIVLDWMPGANSLRATKAELERLMSDPGQAASFPLAADIKDDYRYTK